MFEHKIMRNQELMANWQRSLKKAIETNRYDSRYNVIDRALRGGTPRYDVSYDYALRMMYQMVRDGKPCSRRSKLKRQMWEEISLHVRRVMHRRKCTIAEAVATVLAEQKASRYFLSKKQASKIIYHEIHNRSNYRSLTLFSLSSCHSHRAVESTAGLQTHTETADSVAATRRITASAKEASETVEINFFAPDSTGRQAVRSISRHRRLAAEERTDTVAVAATGVSIGTTEQTTSTRRLPTRYRLSLAALLAAATTLILITFTIKKRQ